MAQSRVIQPSYKMRQSNRSTQWSERWGLDWLLETFCPCRPRGVLVLSTYKQGWGRVSGCEALGAAESCARRRWKADAECSSDAPPLGCWGTRSCSGPGCSRFLWSGQQWYERSLGSSWVTQRTGKAKQVLTNYTHKRVKTGLFFFN